MKNRLVSLVIGLISIIILSSGCASTTLLTTVPTGATVYLKDIAQGTTPYSYSDNKIALSSTPITFKKEGYKDLNIVLKKNERPAIGAIIGGIVAYVPLLWFAKYKDSHFYELEKIDIFLPDSGIVLRHDSISAFHSDSVIVRRNTNQLVRDTISAANSTGLSDTISVQQAAPGIDFTKRTNSQFGAGLGFCLKGMFFGLNYTFIGSKNWGVSLSYILNPFKAKDIPVDYDRPFTPKDFVNIVSANLLRAFTAQKRNYRFRIEAGPSWVSYSKAKIGLNPNYDPNYDNNQSWFWNLWNGKVGYKYSKSHRAESTIGASVTAKMEFLYAPSASMEVVIFTNINALHTITGCGFCMNFGDVRD
jgi:hypothetical protein